MSEAKIFYTITLTMPSGKIWHFLNDPKAFALAEFPEKATRFYTLFEAEDYLFELRASAPPQHKDLAKALTVMAHESAG